MFYDAASNTLFYDTPQAEALASAVDGARIFDNRYVGMPASLPNLQKLVALNLPVVGPMNRDYDWPIIRPHHAREHQKTMSNFMVLNPRCFNLSGMGTMKTLAALWGADYIMRQHAPGTCRTLIVAPLSTLRRVWQDAVFQNFLGKRTAVVLHGDARKRESLLAEPHDFYIINHDGLGVGATVNRKIDLTGLSRSLYERTDIPIAIVDECSVYRDPSTRRHRIARAMFETRPYLWMMSGTPTPNGPLDAYGQAKLLNNAYGETRGSFQSRTMTKVSTFKWVPNRGASEEAKKLLSPAVRFKIEDCVDLPPCTTQRRDAELSAEQVKAINEMKRDLKYQIKSGKHITAVNEGVLRWKLLQIAAGVIYGENGERHFIDSSPRKTILREVLEEASGKILVFAPLTAVIESLYEEFRKTRSCALITGDVSEKKRSEIFREFQEGDGLTDIYAHPETMAHGLTLVKATTTAWYMPTDKTETYLQANKRFDRPGQTKPTTIVQIAATPLEREIYRRVEANESMQGLILKLAEQ